MGGSMVPPGQCMDSKIRRSPIVYGEDTSVELGLAKCTMLSFGLVKYRYMGFQCVLLLRRFRAIISR